MKIKRLLSRPVTSQWLYCINLYSSPVLCCPMLPLLYYAPYMPFYAPYHAPYYASLLCLLLCFAASCVCQYEFAKACQRRFVNIKQWPKSYQAKTLGHSHLSELFFHFPIRSDTKDVIGYTGVLYNGHIVIIVYIV